MATKTVVQIQDKDFVESALGKKVLIFGMRYNYTGMLMGVNEKFLVLQKAQIVFDTGDFSSQKWELAQAPISDTIHVGIGAIESWVILP